jgi:hypothetical protein
MNPMMNPMDSFGAGPGGPMISGEWMNKRTGRKIMVRDSIIDGDQMVVITNCGNIDMNTFSRDYIQTSDDLYDEAGNVIGKEAVKVEEVVQQTPQTTMLQQPLQPQIDVLHQPIAGGQLQQTSTAKLSTVQDEELAHEGMIQKILNKIESKPKINLSIEWTEFPTNELKMLVDYFDVTTHDIAAYIGKHFVDGDAVAASIEDFLQKRL